MTTTIDPRASLRAALVTAVLLAGAGCTQSIYDQPGDAQFGEANRQTMMAQVVDPDPVYTEPAPASGHLAAEAIQRYRDGEVKQPDTIRTTNVGEGDGGGSSPQ